MSLKQARGEEAVFKAVTFVRLRLPQSKTLPEQHSRMGGEGGERKMVHGRQQQESATEMSSMQLINLLNEDLRRHLEAIMLCVNYSEILGGNADRNIARQLAKHLHTELQQALRSAERLCSLGAEPEINPPVIQGFASIEEMLRFKLEDKAKTIRGYLARVRQCEALGEHAMAGQIREILLNEQQHQIYLATALMNHLRDMSRPSINVEPESEARFARHRIARPNHDQARTASQLTEVNLPPA